MNTIYSLYESTTYSVPYRLDEKINNLTFFTCYLSKDEILKLAFKYHSQENYDTAIKYYEYFIIRGFLDPRVFSNCGVIFKKKGQITKAISFYQKSILLFPDIFDAHYNIAILFKDLGKSLEAERAFRAAIQLKPDHADSYLNLGVIMSDLGKLNQAKSLLFKAVNLKPKCSFANYNLSLILRDLGDFKQAEVFSHKAIELNSNYIEAYINLGLIQRKLGKLNDAKKTFLQVIDKNPDHSNSFCNLATICRDLGQLIHSINYYKKAISLNEKLFVAKAGLLSTKALICDWSDQKITNSWLNSVGITDGSVGALSFFYLEDNPSNHLKRAKQLYNDRFSIDPLPISLSKKKKIHIGYFSSDFRAHPTMYLIASLFELHDKSKFNIFLYSFAPNEDEYTDRAKKSGCIFRNINDLSNDETIHLALSDQLDIAIDLMGYIKNNRMAIFAHRVAPIQINYLGFPGSLGAKTIDYILADSVVIPEEYDKYYSEKVLRMPNCYQCNDVKKEISNVSLIREDCNLPESGFVFTCFNANNKITHKEFDIWMRLINNIKGSVLWLYASNDLSVHNLRLEAEKRNVDPSRLVFAESWPLNKHLARHSLGDLGLDTFNYNGHTTTSDALWAGLPVLTKIGKSFASRVSASLLTSLGLPELITQDEHQYEKMALELAHDKKELQGIKSKINKLRDTSSLYNSKLYTNDLERIFFNLVNN